MNINFQQKFSTSTEQLIRRCGYGRDRREDQVSYSRRLGNGNYPRFHMYINSQDPLILSLHLDQKKASYQGHTAHSGDYDSDLVKKEAERIYNVIVGQVDEGTDVEEEEEGGFLSRIFGK